MESAEWKSKMPLLKKVSHKQSLVILRIQRESGYYVQNIVGIMTMLSILGFTIFALGDDSLADRINTVLTLLLTAVAFKFAVADSMPKVGYSTLMDIYFIKNMMCLFLMAIFSVIWDLFRGVCDPSLLELSSILSLNRLLGTLALIIYLLANAKWALLASKSTQGMKAYDTSSSSSWYGSRFSNPLFLVKSDAEKNPLLLVKKERATKSNETR